MEGGKVAKVSNAYLMSRVPNHRTLLGERLERVSWDEKRSLDVVFIEELQETWYSYCAGKYT